MPPMLDGTSNINNDLGLTEVEETYLRSCIVNYHSTPPPEKDAFHENCVKYIMWQRTIGNNDAYALQLLRLKVKNWFQNHACKGKSTRLPMRVNQGFSPMHIWALLNKAVIRKSIEEQKAAAPDRDDCGCLTNWNATKRHLWEELPEVDRRVYERLAKKWALEGPDEGIKPVLAEKRSPSWMRSVAHLFWIQCKMPLFMYGMYKDKDGVLHAVVYDTSNLWQEADKSTPLFRNLPGWDQDFRCVAWTYFQAILRPDLATTETLQVMKASKRSPPTPISFLRHADQCPILFLKEGEGKEMINSRWQEIFHEFIKVHYNLAVGREMRSAPWSSMCKHPSKFFEDGMLPHGFAFNDPSHIGETLLIPFFEHVVEMECPTRPGVAPHCFRFYQFERGSGDNRMYHPAVYNGVVEPAAPRRTKKTVTVLEFEDPPPTPGSSHGADETDDTPDPSAAPPLDSIAAAFASDLEAARAEVDAKIAAEAADGTGQQSTMLPARSSTTNASIAVACPLHLAATASRSLPLLLDVSPWLTSEIDAAACESDGESELTEEEYTPPANEDMNDYDEDEDYNEDEDDDKVEGFLNDLGPVYTKAERYDL